MRRNVFVIQRSFAGHQVTIKAKYIERLSVYSLTIELDGQLWDARHSDDVLPDAARILEEAYAELAEAETA